MMLNSKFSPQIREQFHKTKMCRFYPVGECRYGQDCPYAHDESEIEHTPDLTKTALCTDFEKGCCLKNPEECPFAHGREELRTTDAFSESPLCKRAVSLKESQEPDTSLPDHQGKISQDDETSRNPQPQFQPFNQAQTPVQMQRASEQDVRSFFGAAGQSSPNRPSGKQRKARGRQAAKASAETTNGGATPMGGTTPSGAVVVNLANALVPDPNDTQAPVQARGVAQPPWGAPAAEVAVGMPLGLSLGLPPAGYPSQTLRGRSGCGHPSPMPIAPTYTPAVSPNLRAPSGTSTEALAPSTPNAKEHVTLPGKSRLSIVGGSSPETPTATPGSAAAQVSPARTTRSVEAPRDDDEDNSPRWMADPAYVCSTAVDYRSVSPGGHSDASGGSGSRRACDVNSPRRCWPRTPSSCASPERHSPAQRWPQTPSSAAALSPNASPSPPRRKRGGGLTPAALDLHLRDIFGTSAADLPNRGPGIHQPWPPLLEHGGGSPMASGYHGHRLGDIHGVKETVREECPSPPALSLS
mmetsp:Transcript_148532/g.386187  ORF Transcript_148532/g.386187 Transcript_148532/m.386187 type:complete len:525 (-) Transcript_148532:190-1764(-)